MLNVLPHGPQPGTAKASDAVDAVITAQEAQDAIRREFPCAGELRIHHLWSADGVSRFRANWFRPIDRTTMIVKSLLLGIK